MLTALPRRLPLVLALAAVVACDDDDDPAGPSNSVNFEGIVANCVEGDIGVADETPQVVSGTVDDDDCFNIEQARGRVEAWRLPQGSFGTATTLELELFADFDGVILVLNEQGMLVDFADADIGDVAGHEYMQLDFDVDPAEPTYYIAIFSYEDELAGDYDLTVGAVPAT